MRPSNSATQRPGRYVPALLALTFLILSVSASATDDVWVRIHHSASDSAIASFSLDERLSDYGNMQWGRISATQAAELKAAGVRISIESNPFVLDLGGERFDPLDSARLFTAHQADPAGDFHLVQFAGPIRPEWLSSLRASGLQVVQPLHPFSYIVWADGGQIAAARSQSNVRFAGPMLPQWKVQPHLREFDAEARSTMALASAHFDQRQLWRELSQFGQVHAITPLNRHFNIVHIDLPGQDYQRLADLPAIYTVQYIRPETGPRGEMSNQSIVGNINGGGAVFPGYVNWLNTTGFDGTGVKVGIVDSGTNINHVDLADNIVPCLGTEGSCGGPGSGHGTHVAGGVAGTGASGETNAAGFLRGQGVAPGASLIAQRYNPFLQPGGPGQMVPDGMLRIYKDSAESGALLTNNSWGPTTTPQGYDIPTQQIDFISRDALPDVPGHQPVLAVWSIMNGNGDSGGACAPASQASPDEAKNLFAVGSTALQTGSGAQAANIFRVSANSAHGPACDGRQLPHIVAPGCQTDSTSPATGTTGWGLACGTSMASPVVSGAVAVWAEKYIEQTGTNPSPALVKAVFTAAAQDLIGNPNADGGIMGHRPDRFQGYGRLDLDLVMNHGLEVFTFDQEEVFTAVGQDWSIGMSAVDPSEPIRIMLAWTDAPGHGLGGTTPAWLNNLDLVVEANGNTYLGNVIGADGWSDVGGNADDRNNLEGVFLSPAQHGGSVNVIVSASEIIADALNPWDPDEPSQDFALACYNCIVGDPTFSIGLSPSTLEACLPDTGSNDYNIDVNVSNVGDYSGTVQLSATNVPAGISNDFDPASVNVPGSAEWTLSVGAATAPGAYAITVSGDDGEDVQTRDLNLVLDAPLVSGPTLEGPANGAGDTSLTPTFSWSSLPDVEDYRIQVASDSGFGSIVIDENLTGTDFTPVTELATGTEYFWRVQGSNLCGGGEWSQIFSFTTRLEPVAEFSADSFSFVVTGNSSDDALLEIGNIGTGNLTWTIETDQLVSSDGAGRFSGHFDPANWTLVNTPANVGGSVNVDSGPPVEVFVVGGNDGTGGTTDFSIEVPTDGEITFDWGYQSGDSGNFDRGGYVLNGTFTQLANNAGQVPFFNETQTVPVSAGDIFAFRVATEDGLFGEGEFGVTNFGFAPSFCGDELTNVPWMSTSPTSGVTAAGDTDNVQINIDSTGLLPGDYTGYLCVSTNDPAAELFPITVDLTVTTGSGPIASVNPSSLAFDLLVDESDSAELDIINSGNETVTFDLLDSGNAASCFDPLDVEWLSTSVDSGSVAPSDALDLLVSVDATELAAGNYSTTLCLTTNDPAAPLIEVAVELTVSAATGGPVAAVDPGSFSLQLGPDDVAVESLLISNQGDELLTWDIETAEGASSRQFQRGSDIVSFTDIDFTPNPDFTGGAVRWFTGDTCNCDDAPFDFNPYDSPVQWFWPNNATQNVGGVSLDGGITYAVLEPGDAIGPASSFLAVTAVGATINWRQADGVEGYLGFQFDNPDTGQINYGYAHITTGDETGHPMTIHGWAFNQAGDPITVAPLGEPAACSSPASIPWLSVDPASGSTVAGGSSNVQLDIDTTGLADGQYQALLCISTNDADNELIEVPVWLEILEDALFADRFEADQGRSSKK